LNFFLLNFHKFLRLAAISAKDFSSGLLLFK
jgi:hypothetical protein